MDHIKVVKRAFEITWRYKAVWIFGIILALTTANASSSNSGASFGGSGGGGNGGYVGGGVPGFEIPSEIVGAWVGIAVGAACLVLLIAVVWTIARWVAEVALIRMVDDYEETGERRRVREGFRMGWSRSALRLFLIDLVVILPIVVAFIILFLLTAAPAFLWLTDNTAFGIAGTIATVGLFFLVILLAIIVGVVASVLLHFFRRACVMEEMGVGESIRHGYDMAKRHWKDVGLMWLLMLGLKIVWALLMLPITFLLVILGSIVGGVPGLLVGLAANAAAGEIAGWVSGGIVAGLIFFAVVSLPVLFLGGLAETFKSTIWTLTYRELRVLEGSVADAKDDEPLPELDELDPDDL
jgi:hypothetical protein